VSLACPRSKFPACDDDDTTKLWRIGNAAVIFTCAVPERMT
jgi:hypothetical protein